MVKRALSFLLIAISLSPLCAKVEVWLGFGGITGFDFLTRDFIKKLQSDTVETPDFKGRVEYLDLIGPYYEISIFPYVEIPLSIDISGSTSFIVGIQGNSFISRHLDFRQNLKIGSSYLYMFKEDTGLYFSLGYFVSWTRISTTNYKNNKLVTNHIINQDMGVSLGFGVVTRFRNAFFKFGLTSDKVIQLKDSSGLSVDLFVGGGFVF